MEEEKLVLQGEVSVAPLFPDGPGGNQLAVPGLPKNEHGGLQDTPDYETG